MGGKPPGVSLTVDADGPRLRVTQSDDVQDKVYEAVREAVLYGWTPERFIEEAREAWDYEMHEMRDAAAKAFRKAQT